MRGDLVAIVHCLNINNFNGYRVQYGVYFVVLIAPNSGRKGKSRSK